jgi:hypothetical protein
MKKGTINQEQNMKNHTEQIMKIIGNKKISRNKNIYGAKFK